MATKLEGKTAVALPGDDKLFFTQLGEFSAKFENSLILILVNALSLTNRLKHCSRNYYYS